MARALALSARVAAAAPSVTLDVQHPVVVFGPSGGGAPACSPTDYPDTPASAVRIGAQVCLYTGNGGYPNHRMCGSSLDTLKRECTDILHSPKTCDPGSYSFDYWPTAVTNVNGTLLASVDMEFHGWECGASYCSKTTGFDTCWMNAALLATASPSGPIAAPALLQPPATPYQKNLPPYGSFMPSNIVSHSGAYYMVTSMIPAGGGAGGLCTLQSKGDPSRVSSWMAWDGRSFSSPSVSGSCAAAAGTQGLIVVSSLRWSTFYNRWLLVGTNAQEHVMHLSSDLLTWAGPYTVAPWAHTQPAYLMYPSFIDPASADFSTVGRTARLYFTYISGGGRDLVYYDATFAGTAAAPSLSAAAAVAPAEGAARADALARAARARMRRVAESRRAGPTA